MTRTGLRGAAALLVVSAALSSCSDSGGGPDPGDTTPPTVTERTVSDGETDVGLIEELAVVFSEDMDESTINRVSAYVAGRSPTGHVSYDAGERRLSIVPDTLYAQSVWHELVLTDSLTDLAGNALSPDTTEFQTGTLDCAHLSDRLEPNAECAHATHVEIDTTYHTLSVCGNDQDFYSFTVTDTAKVSVRTLLKAAAPSCSWSIHLLRDDGEYYTTSGFSAAQGEWYASQFSFLPGTYYAEIYGGTPAPYVLYDLEVTTDEPCRDDAYEDNDFADEAAAVSPGLLEGLRGCSVDQDFYSFQAEAGQSITVTAVQLPHGFWPHNRIIIYGPGQSQLATQDSDEMTHSLSAVATTTGTHYAAVRFWSEVGYTLDLDVTD